MDNKFKVLDHKLFLNPNGSIGLLLAVVKYSKNDIRVLLADQKIRHGYMSIPNTSDYILSSYLLEIAEYGMEITYTDQVPAEWIDKYNLRC